MHSLLLPKQLTLIHPLFSVLLILPGTWEFPYTTRVRAPRWKRLLTSNITKVLLTFAKRDPHDPQDFLENILWIKKIKVELFWNGLNSGTSDIKLTQHFIKREKRNSSLVHAAGQLPETNQQVRLWTVRGQFVFTQGQVGLLSLCASVKNVQKMKKSCRGEILFYSTVPRMLDLVG